MTATPVTSLSRSIGRVALPAVLTVLATFAGGCSMFRPHPGDKPIAAEQPPGQVIDPDIARRAVKVPKIRASDFEVAASAGVISVQDMGSHFTYGARAAYHVTEDFFLEADYDRSSVSDQVRREIGQPFFPQQTIGMTTYGIDLGYNVLPGEVFIGTRHAMTSDFYLIGGAGTTSFNSEDFLTYDAGFGMKVLPINWLSLRLEARDRMWKSDIFGTKQFTHNPEISFGVAGYF